MSATLKKGDIFYIVHGNIDEVLKCTVIEIDYLNKRYPFWRDRHDIFYSCINHNGKYSERVIGAESFWQCYSDNDSKYMHSTSELKQKIFDTNFNLNLFNTLI